MNTQKTVRCFICLVFISFGVLSCTNSLWPISEDGNLSNIPAHASVSKAVFPGANDSNVLEMITVTFGSRSSDSYIIGQDVEEDAKVVTVRPFRLAKYELSYNLWYLVYTWATSPERGDKIYKFAHTGSEGTYSMGGIDLYLANTGAPVTTGMPVTGINWRDAAVWCNAFSEMSGLRPIYYTDGAMQSVYRNACYTTEDGGSPGYYDKAPGACMEDVRTCAKGGKDNPYMDLSANGYRLPFETEWEYAARKKSDGTFLSGKCAAGDSNGICGDITMLDKLEGKTFPLSKKVSQYAWFNHRSETPKTLQTTWDDSDVPEKMKGCLYRTHKQGTKLPTDLGFCDLSGNINEWCNDFAMPYSSKRSTYSLKACRGGVAWYAQQVVQVGERGGASMYDGKGGMRLAQNAR